MLEEAFIDTRSVGESTDFLAVFVTHRNELVTR